MPTCQYADPKTGERCDKETDYTITLRWESLAMQLPVCEGEHAQAMTPRGRSKGQQRRFLAESEQRKRRREQVWASTDKKKILTQLPPHLPPHLIWPVLEEAGR